MEGVWRWGGRGELGDVECRYKKERERGREKRAWTMPNGDGYIRKRGKMGRERRAWRWRA